MTVTLPKHIELGKKKIVSLTNLVASFLIKELDNGSIYKMLPDEVSFKDKNGIWMTRRQFLLSLGYAITVHRSQCMTYDKLVVDLTGINWKPDKAESKRKPEDLIIHEKQEQLFCGRHVLRALSLTLDLFDDDYLIEVAQNIAATEQINRHGGAIQLTKYYYENTGEYDIQVLKAALMNIFNIDLIQIGTLQPNSLILSHIQQVQAFLIQQNYHYYCLRRFRLTEDYFFKIDYKNPTYHVRIHRDNILNFLKTLLEHGSNIYVTVQYISDAIEDEITTDNIKTRLWALPDAPADREALVNI
ncbi:unnamed protein product [Adineta steineri]|uniref:ubiquitinyl hydrolase 1 n=1 Tax=Adineta steineri TaxID=433720 RepID=A0A815PKD2_9BILA|nr:unnamed protein product [Adineta steineri]